jgi:rhamnogalacturonan endolyase
MKKIYFAGLFMTVILFLSFATKEKSNQYIKENPGRGIVAIRTNPEEVFLNWRLLETDPVGITFNIYRGNQKLNASPVTLTNYTDKSGTDAYYTVRTVIRGKEQKESASCSVWDKNFIRIPLNRPKNAFVKGVLEMPEGARNRPPDSLRRNRPNGPPPGFEQEQRPSNPREYTYSPGDASIADLDGDGQYEIVLKWDPSNARDNAQDGFTGSVIFDAYKLDGKQLWRINLGKNIRSGAHYTQFLVYDFDGDGKAEMACKTADGTLDGTGKIVGDSTKDYVNERGRILEGPEYLTVFNGLTGAAMATVDYVPPRGDVCAWGANECKGNRVDRFLACVANLDGKLPSLVFGRGYYGRLTIAAWDWRQGKLTQRWFFDSDKGHQEYMGQGNHNLSVADIDNDGKDEIVYGSSAYDDNGEPIYTTGMGHGDAMHLSDLDPDVQGLEIWACKETGNQGAVLHSAANGKILMQVKGNGDTGRALAADIYPDHRGFELWSSTSRGIWTVKGEKITDDVPSVNFRIYWDGDLQDELLDRSYIDDWDFKNNKAVRLLDASQDGGSSINGTKANPIISADILGDWREEVIFRGRDNASLLLYSTTIPTEYRMVTPMQDNVYRKGIAWQNVVYNQPPHLGYYIGDGIPKDKMKQ